MQALAAASLGLSAAFVTVSVGGVAFALLGRSTMPVAGPRSATALIVAGLLAELARDPATVGGAHGLGLAMSAIGCTVALAGRAQIALGASRLGRFAQFVPQPVLTGFMNGVALLIVVSQRPALLGTHDGSLASLLDPAGWHPRTLAIGLATAGCTWLLAWRWPRSPHQLLGLGFGIALYALAVALNPDDPPGAQIGPEQPGRHWPDLPRRLGEADTAAFMLRHASAIVATAAVLALIGTLESVLNALAIDQQLGTDHDASRELLTLGATNLVVGLFCGRQAVMLRTRAQATLNAGGAGRRGRVRADGPAARAGAGAAAQGRAGGIMLTVAFALVDRWTHQLLDQWRSGERSADLRQSLATVGIVCAVTLWKGLAVAVAVGTGLALLQFVRAMNRSLLRSICTAADRPSRRLYPPAQEAALQALRSRIAVIELEGALLRGLDATQAATLRAAMRRRTLAAGELLFRQGDPADGLYLLTRGSITITAGSGADPAQRRYVSFSAGHMLGETAMLDGGARSASATADGPVELLHLPGEALDGLNRREPVLASQVHRNIAVHLSERLRHATRLSQIAPISGR